MNPTVSIIILNFNGLKFLEPCLNSIKSQTYKNLETIVVDDVSTDESIAYLSSIDWINLIINEKNIGYTGGNNKAAQVATGEFILFLNNDTVLESNFIEQLIKCHTNKSIVAPYQVLMSKPESAGFAGNGSDMFGYPYGGSTQDNTKIFYADGSALFMKKSDFMELGMFDEALFMFQEDLDLCWRAQLQGFSIISCTSAKYLHYSGGTSIGGAAKEASSHVTSYFRREYVERNTIRNIIKNYSLVFLIPIFVTLVFFHLLEVIVLAILLKWRVINCYIRAYVWNVKMLSGTFKWRRKVQLNRTISDTDIIKRMSFGYSKLTALIRVKGMPNFK